VAASALPSPYRETIVLRDIQGLVLRRGDRSAYRKGDVSRVARAPGRLIATMAKDEEQDGIDARRAQFFPLCRSVDTIRARQAPLT
jgi:hypothetical protein